MNWFQKQKLAHLEDQLFQAEQFYHFNFCFNTINLFMQSEADLAPPQMRVRDELKYYLKQLSHGLRVNNDLLQDRILQLKNQIKEMKENGQRK